MKRFIFRLISYFFLFSFLYLSLVCISIFSGFTFWGIFKDASFGNGFLYHRIKDVKNIKNPDILFIGSSHSYRGFDPRIFQKEGITSFNLGSSAQTPINTQVLLKQYLQKIQPKMVVYEIYPYTLEMSGIESGLDIIANNKIDTHSINMAIKLANTSIYNAFIIKVLKSILITKSDKENIIQKDNGDKYILNTGFVENNTQNSFFNNTKIKTYHPDAKQLKALRENIEYIKQHNIPTLLVQAPISNNLYHSYTNNQEIDSLLSTLNVRYKNYNGKVILNDTLDFFDDDHLNQKGVVQFNQKFIEDLKRP